MNRLQAATDTLKELAAVYAALLLISALIFMALEGHSFAASLYWAGTTATSTGYGDISPRTVGGQVLAFVLMHLSIFGIAPLIVVRLVDRLNENRDAFTHEEQVQILEGLRRMEDRLTSLELGQGSGAGSNQSGL
jgi:voltage-gated potassium channel